MNLFNGFLCTVSTFSKIPTFKNNFENKSFSYTLIFLPFIGLVIGLINYLLLKYLINDFDLIIKTIIIILVPILITGGIHLDGFLDTSDAISSYQSFENRAKIIKDPRIGAFALIKFTVYLLMCFVLYYLIIEKDLLIFLIVIPVISRSIIVYIIYLNTIEKEDILDIVVLNKFKYINLISNTVIILIACFFTNILILLPLILVVIILNFHIKKNFKVVNGDICGYCITLTEVVCAIFILLLNF